MSAHGSLDVAAAPAAKEIRILLIEDNADDALLLERNLRKAGFLPRITRVETAGAMQAALGFSSPTPQAKGLTLEAPNRQRWDIILADYNLPLFSAPEALDLLKSTPLDIPFIMMSGAVNEATAVAAMRAGAHDYVSKQNLARLAPAIEREINEAASRRTKRAAERALRSSQARFHRLVEAMPLALLISDAAGSVTYINQGLERLLGFSQEEIEEGTLTLERIFPGRTQTVLARGSIDHGETIEIECLKRDGTPILVLLGAAVLNPEAPPSELQTAAFLADLSEQKRSEEVLRRTEKLAAAGKLSASIAHEINNPLEAVTNCLYLLEQTELSELQRSYLALGQRELARVAHITTQTLRFYRQSTRAVATDVRDLFDTVMFLYEARIRDHGIVVERDFRNVPPVVAYDGEIRQVLANFVGNALDAIQSSPIPLHASEEAQPQPRILLRSRRSRDWRDGREGVAVTVADTGSGMSPATLKRIYEPFFSTKGITGTGLGLWISADIITKHGGVLRVRSRQQPPSGTVFRLFLPFEHVEVARSSASLPTLAQR
jgi:PAS domain S-box-containing protein